MKKYKFIGDIVLSFIIADQQYDVLLGEKEGGTLKSDGVTVWYITPEGEKHESITTANVIDVALERNDIEEI